MEKTDLKKPATSREMTLGALFLVALLFVFMRILYLPKGKALQEIKTKIETMQLEKSALIQFSAATAKQTPSNLKALKKNADIKMQILSGEKKATLVELAPLMNTLTQPSFRKGLSFDSLAQLPTITEKGYTKAPFTMHATGSFERIVAFLEKMGRLPALVAVDSVSLTANAQKDKNLKLELTATLYEVEETNAQTAKK